jgi:short-subunit dehydrogenase
VTAARPVTIITGASAGIGHALARVFAEHGHELLLVALSGAKLHAAADAVAASGKPRPHVLAFDLAQPDCSSAIDAALSAKGLEPNFVVNNAGFGLLGDASALDRAEQLRMIDVNMRALTDLSLRWIDSLARHQGGILNVASIAAFLPRPGMAGYHATKAYALSFSEALHHELKPKGVRVTVLCPGPVPTEFQARAGIPEGFFDSRMIRSAERVAREGYEGLMKGRRVVIPGTVNKIVTLLPRFLSRARVLRLAEITKR